MPCRDSTWAGAREGGLDVMAFMATPPSPEPREALSPRLGRGGERITAVVRRGERREGNPARRRDGRTVADRAPRAVVSGTATKFVFPQTASCTRGATSGRTHAGVRSRGGGSATRGGGCAAGGQAHLRWFNISPHCPALPTPAVSPPASVSKNRFVVRVNLVNYSDDFAPSRLPPTRIMLGGRGWARAGGAGGVLGLILAFSQLQETVPREAGETSDAAADSYQKLAVACLARDSLRACTHTRSPAPALPVPPVQLITGPVHHHQDLAWQSGARFPKGERSSANVSSCASVAGCAMLSR